MRGRPTNVVFYTGSAKYQFNDDLMAYATIGSSWRPGAFAVGDFNEQPSPRERSFFDLPPETSTSYEIGIKATFLDKKARLNVSAYRQDFDNYVYRGPAIYYRNITSGVAAVNTFNFVAAVPARVEGVEVDAGYQLMKRWSISGNFSYADGKIKNGLIACNDLNRDGIPDANAARPTEPDLRAALGNQANGTPETVAQCRFNGRTLTTPKWNASLTSEAGFSLTNWSDGFVRGLLTYTPRSDNDPNNTFDDVSGYALLNLYAGFRAPDGAWELSFFAKNLFDTRKIVSQGANPVAASIRQASGSLTYTSDYAGVSTLVPRELGVSMRFALGSR